MTKLNFLLSLRDALSSLPQEESEERLRFYSEMIEDRVEEGLTEEEAVAAVGSVEEIANQIRGEFPYPKAAPKTPKPKKRLNAGEILLLVLGSPLWLSLLITAFAVVFALWISLWAVVVSLWAVFASVAACSVAGITAGIGFIVGGYTHTGIAMIGAGIVCAGLSILLFYGCHWATKGAAWLTKKTSLGINKCFTGKEEV